MRKNQRFQAREAFNLDGRAIVAGEVLILPEGTGRLYVQRGQLVRLADNAPVPPVAAEKPASKPRKPRASKAADLETKDAPPSAPAPAPDDDPAAPAPADEVS